MKKRLTAFLILISMISVFTVFAWAEETVDMEFQSNIDMLDTFGILTKTGSEAADAFVTRGEFSVYLYNALQLPEYSITSFTDVEGKQLTAVAALERQGIVLGSGTGFRPDDIITNTDAAVMIMRALGYELAVKSTGGYPVGYLMYARSSGVLKGIANDVSEHSQLADTAKMLCNMLEAHVFEIDDFSSDSFAYHEGGTFLEEFYNTYSETGILQGDHRVHINGLKTSIKEGAVTFEYKQYNTAIDLSEYLGYKITVYYKKINGENTIIFAKDNGLSRVNSISGFNVTDLNKSRYVIEYVENKKTKKIDFYNGTNFILNGEYVTDIANTDLAPKDGKVTAINNTGDTKADVIFIEKYDYYIAERVSEYEKFIVDKITGQSFSADYEKLVVRKDGNIISLSDIMPGQLLEVKKNLNGVITNITVYDSLSGIFDGSTDKEMLVNGQEIPFSKFYLDLKAQNKTEAIDLSADAKYYVNHDGRIVWIETDTSEKKNYGYLIDIGVKSGIENENALKILTSGGNIQIFDVSEKFRLNNIVVDNRSLLSEANLATGGKADSQLVMYELDSSGKVRKLYTALDTSGNTKFSVGDIETIRANKDTFSYDYLADSSVRYIKGTVASGFTMTGNTVIFNIPRSTVTNASDDDYYIGSLSQFEEGKMVNYPIAFYDLDEELVAGAVVIERPKTQTVGTSLFIFDSLKSVWDSEKGEARTCVTGFSGGKLTEYVVEEEDYKTVASTYGTLYGKDYSNKGWNNLKAGDIFYIGLNKDNELSSISLCAYDVKNLKVDYMLGGYNSLGISDGRETYGGEQFCTASVYDVTANYFYVKTKSSTDGSEMIRRFPKAGNVYMLKNGDITSVTFNEISDNDRVVVALRYDKPVITLIVKD